MMTFNNYSEALEVSTKEWMKINVAFDNKLKLTDSRSTVLR